MSADPKINGDAIELHYGDQVETLPERLRRQDVELRWLKRAILVIAIVLIFHAILPTEQLLPYLLTLF
jgi:hypothetical protein